MRPKGGVLNSMLATVIDLSRLGDPAKIAADIEAAKAYVKSARSAPGFDEVLTSRRAGAAIYGAADRTGDRGG